MRQIFSKTKQTLIVGTAIGLSITACSSVPASHSLLSVEPIISKTTPTQVALQKLPPPSSKVTVAVYEFEDKTGQFKPTTAGQTLSRAVTQGGDEVLIKALHDAGLRSWFTVIERSNLNNLLKERQIITEMRSRYLGETSVNSKALPPLLFAGVIFEGGIVGFDTNTVTGGAAARYLGIGGRTDYRQNVVTVHLRAVSVKTGEVLASVTTEKTIASVGISANAFRFVTFDNLLEADAGITSNEPGMLALRQAVEKSVYALIMEGAEIGLWEFSDQNAGLTLLNEYQAERGGYKLTESVLSASNLGSNQSIRQLANVANPLKNRIKARKLSRTERMTDVPQNSKTQYQNAADGVAKKKVARTRVKKQAIRTEPVKTAPQNLEKTVVVPVSQPVAKTISAPVIPVVRSEYKTPSMTSYIHNSSAVPKFATASPAFNTQSAKVILNNLPSNPPHIVESAYSQRAHAKSLITILTDIEGDGLEDSDPNMGQPQYDVSP